MGWQEEAAAAVSGNVIRFGRLARRVVSVFRAARAALL